MIGMIILIVFINFLAKAYEDLKFNGNLNKSWLCFACFWLLAGLLNVEVNAQPNFNYVGNGDFKDHNCTTAQLSSMYTCNKPYNNYPNILGGCPSPMACIDLNF